MSSEYHCPLLEDECITVDAEIFVERKERIGRFSVLYANYYDLATDGLRHRKYFDNAYYKLEYTGQHYAPDDEIPYNPDGSLAFSRSESYYLYVYSADGELIDTISSSAYRVGTIWNNSSAQSTRFWVNLLPVVEWQSITQEAEDIYRQETYKINKADYVPGVFTKQLQVTDEAYNFVPRTLDPINPYLEIPRHCWNIYMVAYPLPTPFLLISTAEVQLIMQICTDDPGTFERPILEVSCGCGESCPEGTCPVECTDHVCCYGSDGISVQEIPLINYDG